MIEKFRQFMIGRYGTDDLSRFSLISAAVLVAVNLFLRIPLINTLVLILFVWIYFRIFSRQIGKRSAENRKYLELKGRFLGFFRKQGRMLEDRKVNHIYRCPGCGQKIRIPRGKGKICITCPKCRTEFIKKS